MTSMNVAERTICAVLGKTIVMTRAAPFHSDIVHVLDTTVRTRDSNLSSLPIIALDFRDKLSKFQFRLTFGSRTLTHVMSGLRYVYIPLSTRVNLHTSCYKLHSRHQTLRLSHLNNSSSSLQHSLIFV